MLEVACGNRVSLKRSGGQGKSQVKNETATWRDDVNAMRADLTLWPLALLTVLSAVISFVSVRALGTVVPVCLVLALVLYFLRTRSFALPSTPLLLIWALFVALVGLAAFRSLDVDYATSRFLKLAVYSLLAILLWSVAQRMNTRSVLKFALVVSFAIGLCWTLVEGISNGALYQFLSGVTPGEAAHSANRAVVVLTLFAAPAALIIFQRYGGLAVVCLFATLFVAVLTTESQAAQLGVLGAMVVLVFALVTPRAAIWVCGVGGILTIVVMPFLFSQVSFDDLFSGMPNAEMTLMPRLEIWTFVSQKILEQPLLGYGLETGRFMPIDDMVRSYFPGEYLHHPHNGVLQIWFEMGALGALMLAAAWGLIVRQTALLEAKSIPFVLAGLCCVMIIGSVAHGVWQSWWVSALVLVPFLFAVATAPETR